MIARQQSRKIQDLFPHDEDEGILMAGKEHGFDCDDLYEEGEDFDKDIPARRRRLQFESLDLQKSVRPEFRPEEDYGDTRYARGEVYPTSITQHEDYACVDEVIHKDVLDTALRKKPYDRSAEQLRVLEHFISKILNRQLIHLDPRQVAKKARYLRVEQGQLICIQGEQGTDEDTGSLVYLLFRGSLQLHIPNEIDHGNQTSTAFIQDSMKLVPGASFCPNTQSGPTALPLGAHVTSHSDHAELLLLQKVDFDYMMTSFHAIEKRRAFACIRALPLFAHWSNARIEQLCQKLRWSYVGAGTTVVRQGDPATSVYFLISGNAEVTKELRIRSKNRWPTGKRSWLTKQYTEVISVKLMELGPGSYFGEKGILEKSLRAATVKTLSECVIVSLDKVSFVDLLRRGDGSATELGGESKRSTGRINMGYADDSQILSVLKNGSSSYRSGSTVIRQNSFNLSDHKFDSNAQHVAAVGLLASGQLSPEKVEELTTATSADSKSNVTFDDCDDDDSGSESSTSCDDSHADNLTWNSFSNSSHVEQAKHDLDERLRLHHREQEERQTKRRIQQAAIRRRQHKPRDLLLQPLKPLTSSQVQIRRTQIMAKMNTNEDELSCLTASTKGSKSLFLDAICAIPSASIASASSSSIYSRYSFSQKQRRRYKNRRQRKLQQRPLQLQIL